VFGEMWNLGLGGEREGKGKQQMTGNGFGRAQGQQGER